MASNHPALRPDLSSRPERPDFFFHLRSCEDVGLRSLPAVAGGGISLRSIAQAWQHFLVELTRSAKTTRQANQKTPRALPPPRPELHQLLRRPRIHRHRLQILRPPPVIQNPHLLHARHRAPRRAKLLGRIFPV